MRDAGQRSEKRTGTIAAIGLLIGLVGLFALPDMAGATNFGTKSGVLTDGCAVQWDVATVMDVDLTNDDPTYPGLMTTPDGTPTDYSNGGYITEVAPSLGSPGKFEITHWYGNTASPTLGTVAYWRIPLATDYRISNAQLVVTMPDGASAALDTLTDYPRLPLWGPPYSNYSWGPIDGAAAVNNNDGTWTLPLGDLAANSGVVMRFAIPVAAGTELTEPIIATARVTGAYLQGAAESCLASTTTSTLSTATTVAPTTTRPAPTTTVATSVMSSGDSANVDAINVDATNLAAPSGGLAHTGSNSWPLLALAFGLMAAGGSLRLLSRRA